MLITVSIPRAIAELRSPGNASTPRQLANTAAGSVATARLTGTRSRASRVSEIWTQEGEQRDGAVKRREHGHQLVARVGLAGLLAEHEVEQRRACRREQHEKAQILRYGRVTR